MGIRRFFRRAAEDEELRREMEAHLVHEVDENIARGMTEEEARRQAHIKFGNRQAVREEVWSWNTVGFLDDLARDVRYALRMFARSPGFAAVAILTLALGIGAITAIFSIINGLMLRALPVREPGQLVELLHQYPGEPAFNGFSWDAYQTMREGNHVFSAIMVDTPYTFIVRGQKLKPQTVFGGFVNGTYFETLGLRPTSGRLIGPTDAHIGHPAPVAVVSWSLWRSRFNLDPALLGKEIIVNNAPVTVIGVAPRGFFGLREEMRQDVWLPLSIEPQMHHAFPGWGSLQLVGRLRAGVSISHAQAEMAVLFQSAIHAPGVNPFIQKMKLKVVRAGSGLSTPFRQKLSTPLFVLMAMVGVLLLIACINVATLLLARGASRQHEMDVRAYLGAGRARLIRQTLTESLLLSIAGSGLGILLAYFGARGLLRIFASGRQIIGLPVHFEALGNPDWHVLLFTGAVAITTALLFGAAPAMRACRPTASQPLQQSARTGESRFQRLFGKGLVVSQVALSVMLLTSAALFVGYLSHLRRLNTGFLRDNLLLVTLDTAHSGYNAADFARLSEQLVASLSAIPGVKSATVSSMSPMQGPGASASAFAQEHPDNRHNISINNVAPGYFETYGTPLVAGRSFSAEDQGQPPVAIMNEAAANECFGSEDPIGKHLTLSHITLTTGEITYKVVGVVGDAKYNDIQQPAPPTIYRDLFQEGFIASQLAVRTSIHPDAVVGAVRETESAVFKTVPIMRVRTMNEQIDASIVPERLVAALSGWFGALGAVLAGIGLYGLLAYTMTRRTHEIGVRMALGAMRSDVMRIVLRDALWMVCAGLVIGAPLSFWAKSVASSFIRDMPARSPASILFGGAVMIALGLIAASIPARRAARVDPMVALRYE